jgi:hypothetical protein
VNLCRKCDVFIGYAGAGVALEPEDLTEMEKRTHCWICRRSRDEIAAAGDLRAL